MHSRTHKTHSLTLASYPYAIPLPQVLVAVFSLGSLMDPRMSTRREMRTGLFQEYPQLYGWVYPQLLFVLMILLTYQCIAPLLMPFGIIFFAFSYVMYKYQLLYVYVNKYQCGGDMWCVLIVLAAKQTFIHEPLMFSKILHYFTSNLEIWHQITQLACIDRITQLACMF